MTSAMTTDVTIPRPDRGLPLLVLGHAADPDSERGVECPGDLPPASDPDLVERARAAKAALGDRMFVLGHHYQRDEVIQFADVTGDSFKLAREAAARPHADYIMFCGVHFMAESADILTADHQQVVLPDLAAGCSMADMARLQQVEDAWDRLVDAGVADAVVPITYMNSSADIKAFCGRNGGAVCTSSNAETALRWALDQRAEGQGKVLFLPDQHLGRNTAVLGLGLSLDDCVVIDPHAPGFGVTDEQLRDARMLLWRGHCSVHGRFSARCVDDVRARVPGVNVLVHPECTHDVVLRADYVGSTEYIIATLDRAEPGSAWAIGTELNLVKRLAAAHPDKSVVFLDDTVCYCATMNRIDLPHLVWAMENLVAGTVVNRIEVDPDTAHWARVALDRMLSLPGPAPAKD
jgi:quinolinate synthase